MTYNSIRSSGFWIIGGGSAVSSHISKCVKCRKFRGAPREQKMVDLPDLPDLCIFHLRTYAERVAKKLFIRDETKGYA